MRSTGIALLIVFLLCPAFADESENGSLCVTPAPAQPDPRSAPGLACLSGKLSLKIDTRQAVPWPHKECVKIEGLDLKQRHRVTILCDGKHEQSFSFRFSEFKSKQPCLFITDLYKTAQL